MADVRIQLLDGTDNAFPEPPEIIRTPTLVWPIGSNSDPTSLPRVEMRNTTNSGGLRRLSLVYIDANGNEQYTNLITTAGYREILTRQETSSFNLVTTDVTISASTNGTSSATTLHCCRVGNVVTLFHNGVWKVATGSTKTMCTIPDGYRPQWSAYMACPLVVSSVISGQARIAAYYEGGLTVCTNFANNAEYCFAFTYTTSNGYPS